MTTTCTPLATALAIGDDGTAVLDRRWWSWAGPHGGLLAAVALRRASVLADGRVPRALSAQFLTTLPAGPVQVAAEVAREGGSSCAIHAQLRDPSGAVGLTAQVAFGRSRAAGASYVAVPPPVVATWQDCPAVDLPVEMVPFSAHAEYRAASGMPLAGGPVAELVAWVRLREDDPLDAAALTFLADAMPPALYAATTVPVAVPTVELSVCYAGDLVEEPVRGWVLTRIATRSAADGWCVDDSEIWDPDGRLLAQSRQTRRVLGELVL